MVQERVGERGTLVRQGVKYGGKKGGQLSKKEPQLPLKQVRKWAEMQRKVVRDREG